MDSEGNDERGLIWEALCNLPTTASPEDVSDTFRLLYKIERGVQQLDAGEGIPHEEARRRFQTS